MTPNEKFANEIMTAFQVVRGKGYCFCPNHIQPYKLIAKTAVAICNKDTTRKCLIITPYFDVTTKIKTEIEKLKTVNNYNITYLSVIYFNPKYNYNYDCIISYGIDGDDKLDIERLHKIDNCSKFSLFIFNKINLSNEVNLFLTKHSNFLKTTITPDEIRTAYLYCPVEEYRCGVPLSDIDREEYDKADNFISECITIFGDLQIIEKCARGDKLLNISASEFREQFAVNNGWSEKLDMTSEYDKNIDTIYNPNALNERANTFYTITHKRKEIAIKNDNKIDEVIKIVKENFNKQIVIVSKSGEFAAEIAKKLRENNIECGEYHDCIPEEYKLDEEGNIVTYKSGKNKGQPVIIKSAALSTLYEKAYNRTAINILSIKFASDSKLTIPYDIIIFTDSLTANITDFKTRFVNTYSNITPNIVYRIYSANTIEEKNILNEKTLSNVKIMSNDMSDYIL
mgnify:CR=1 FL=1